MTNDTAARRKSNQLTALMLVKAGVAVFVSEDKTPMVTAFPQLDTSISKKERAEIVARYKEKHGREPKFIGSTKSVDVVNRMFRAFPDATPSIATGPSKLVVIDADSKNDGPELVAKLFDEHGGVPEGAHINTSQSGGQHFIFADPEGQFTNRAGGMKAFGCDIRGAGGQIVAPGAIRKDGKTYGTNDDLIEFLKKYTSKKLPALPDYVVERIGAAPEGEKSVSETETAAVVDRIIREDWPEFDHIFAPGFDYDLDTLREKNEYFAKLYDEPSEDCSNNRFYIARHLLREWKDMPPEHLAVFFENWEGSGELTDDGKGSGNYNLRDVAREWQKNQNVPDLAAPITHTNGEELDAITDEDDDFEPHAAAAVGLLSRAVDIAVFTDPDHIVEGLFSRGQVGVIAGPPNVGKTFSAFDMGMRISEGMAFYGRHTDKCSVLYLAGEGFGGLRNRALAWCKKYKPKGRGMVVRDGVPNIALNIKRGITEIEKAIDESNAMLAAEGEPPVGVVFVDTFAKATAGADENLVKEMQPILNALRALAVRKNICNIPLHHVGKNTENGMRGSSAILGDVDFVIEIIDATTAKKRKLKPRSNDSLFLTLPKMRDGEKKGVVEFRLEGSEQLGVNKWGKAVTSAVVVAVDEPTNGADLDAIGDEDDAPGTLVDELTPDQNRKAEDTRVALCEKIVDAMRKLGQVTSQGVQATVAEVAEAVSALGRMKNEAGNGNFSKAIRRDVFGGEPRTLLPGGWLELQTATGRRSSTFVFRAKG